MSHNSLKNLQEEGPHWQIDGEQFPLSLSSLLLCQFYIKVMDPKLT